MFKRRNAIALAALLWSLAGIAAASDWQCAVDLNGDGCACDPGEASQCTTTDNSNPLCPIGIQNCLPKYEPPVIISVPATYAWKSWFAYSTTCRIFFGVQCSETFELDTDGDGAFDTMSTGSNHPPLPIIWGASGPWSQSDFRTLADSYMDGYRTTYGVPSANARVLAGSEYYVHTATIGHRYQYSITYERLYGPSCPGGGAYNPGTNMCHSEPVCTQGELTADKQQCFLGNVICPAGNYACYPVSGVNKCSPNPCTDLSSMPPDTTNPGGAYPSYTGNGAVGADGSCIGIILIFNGKGGECRPAGVSTAYRDCCSYSGGSSSWLNFCKEEEATVDRARDAGKTHFIEEYCKTRWKFGFGSVCVQRARVYCVFNSKLGRIIQEQGRLQLKAFQPNGIWGDHTSPNCKGFSPQEFQMLDFSRIDLSEFYSDISQTMSTSVKQNMQNSLQQFYNQTVNP